MTKLERNWQYAEQFPTETEVIARARRSALEFGISPVTASIGAALGSIAVMSRAERICEIGTGTGVSGLSLLRHTPHAHLTTIDIEPEYLRHARNHFHDAGIPDSRLRLITGDAYTILPRLNQNSYDLLLIDADPGKLLEFVELGLQVIREGGTIAVPNALWRGKVADPAVRDTHTGNFRDLLAAVSESDSIAATLSPIGSGLLTLTKLA